MTRYIQFRQRCSSNLQSFSLRSDCSCRRRMRREGMQSCTPPGPPTGVLPINSLLFFSLHASVTFISACSLIINPNGFCVLSGRKAIYFFALLRTALDYTPPLLIILFTYFTILSGIYQLFLHNFLNKYTFFRYRAILASFFTFFQQLIQIYR